MQNCKSTIAKVVRTLRLYQTNSAYTECDLKKFFKILDSNRFVRPGIYKTGKWAS